jgi:hypothetical protein
MKSPNYGCLIIAVLMVISVIFLRYDTSPPGSAISIFFGNNAIEIIAVGVFIGVYCLVSWFRGKDDD